VSKSVDSFGGSGKCCGAKYKPMCRPLSKIDEVNSILFFSVQ
jgi:hypothetical protein